MDIAKRRPEALADVLILLVVKDAARRLAITASTAGLGLETGESVDESFMKNLTPPRMHTLISASLFKNFREVFCGS
jgi:hypothetical protein